MQRSWKRFMSSALLTVLTMALIAGCGSGNNNSKGGNAGTDQASGDKDNNKEQVEITFWHVWSEKDAGAIEATVESFNKSQDKIKVKVLGNQDATKQLTAISGGNPPDIALTFWNNIGPWSDAGAVLELDELIQRDNFDLNAVIPAAMDRMKVDGKVYGMPFTMSMANTLMYNKKSFADAGITAPPEDLDQLMAYAEKLTKKENGAYSSMGFLPDYPWIDNVFWPLIFGGSWYDEATGKVTPNLQQNVESIEFQSNVYKKFGADEIGKFKAGLGKRGTPQDPLLTGQLAMMIGWEYNFIEERSENGPIAIAPFPYPAGHPELKGAGMVSPRGVFIPKKAKHQEEAWEFMKYLMSVDTQVQYVGHEKGGVIPTMIAALDDERVRSNEALKPLWDFYDRAKSENLQGFPNSVYINEYLQALSEETEKVLKGEQSAQQAMDKVAGKIQPLADKANK
ncbi:ABC transporter substrate-binding protein [Paenibacillus sp. GCM10027626]|uniref:ABC transporter substrate-binding protein n=1 Tax=Paenibacillus sp. GCM10027626 TaxID=3273411 RepID=UPI00363DDC23